MALCASKGLILVCCSDTIVLYWLAAWLLSMCPCFWLVRFCLRKRFMLSSSWSCVNHVLLDVVQSVIVSAWRAIPVVDILYNNEVFVWHCSLKRCLMYPILLLILFKVVVKLLNIYNAFCIIGAVDRQASFLPYLCCQARCQRSCTHELTNDCCRWSLCLCSYCCQSCLWMPYRFMCRLPVNNIGLGSKWLQLHDNVASSRVQLFQHGVESHFASR